MSNISCDYRDIDLSISNIVLVSERHQPPHWKRTLKSRDTHCLAYVLNGEATIETETTTQSIQNGCLMLLEKGCSDFTLTENGFDYVYACFDDIDNMQNCSVGHFLYPDDREATRALFMMLLGIWNQKPLGYMLSCKSILYDLFNRLIRASLKQENIYPEYSKIETAVRYIEMHYSDPALSIAEVAKACYISDMTMRRYFHRVFGMPPTAFIRQTRIRRAKELLRSGLYSIGEISVQTGFSNLFYFSKVFKRSTGEAPSQYHP